MTPSAILFGAIGTLAETSELQRRAYNAAFRRFDLAWTWERDAYYRMLRVPGGRDRVASYAAERGEIVDAAAIHGAKMEAFREIVETEGIAPRDGVESLLEESHRRGVPVAFCTTTTPEQVALLLDGLMPAITSRDFDWMGDATRVTRGKPAPDIYLAALADLGVDAKDTLAIEDTPESAEAARAAGIAVLGFPGRAAAGRAFPPGVRVVERLGPDILRGGALAAE